MLDIKASAKYHGTTKTPHRKINDQDRQTVSHMSKTHLIQGAVGVREVQRDQIVRLA